MKRRVLATSEKRPKDFEHLMSMYGLKWDIHHEGYVNSYKNPMTGGHSVIHVYEDSKAYDVVVTDTTPQGSVYTREVNLADVEDVIDYLDLLMSRYDFDIVSAHTICNTDHREQVILAAISTRDMAKNLVRVRSSNVWAYAMNVRRNGDRTGDLLAQFKGPNGGAGDIYIYYDVPVKLYRQWVGAPSKGHFFWQHIRNVFKYSKLTGDKRGKLQNAVNFR